MLTGILTPSAGTVSVCGLSPVPQRTRLALRIGVVFGQRSQLWWDLPLRESFTLLRHIYRVPAADHAARLTRCRALLDLDEFLDTPVRQLSLGQRMRGELTAALLHSPEVLFLDDRDRSTWSASRLAVVPAELGTASTPPWLTTPPFRIERLCPAGLCDPAGRARRTSRPAARTVRAAAWSRTFTARCRPASSCPGPRGRHEGGRLCDFALTRCGGAAVGPYGGAPVVTVACPRTSRTWWPALRAFRGVHDQPAPCPAHRSCGADVPGREVIARRRSTARPCTGATARRLTTCHAAGMLPRRLGFPRSSSIM